MIGGGTMGAGIVTAALLAGRTVTMIERDEAALGRGIETVRGHLGRRAEAGQARRGGRMRAALGRLSGATDYAALAAADLVIEAVFEDMDGEARGLRRARPGDAARRRSSPPTPPIST